MAETTVFAATQEDISKSYQAHFSALSSLHPYNGAVVKRVSMPERGDTPYSTFREEKVFFEDGAVRTATYAEPKESWFGGEGICEIPVLGGDALMTGPNGINALTIDNLAQLGFRVIWLHHQGRHMQLPTSPQRALQFGRFIFRKSVGRSAHHDHYLLNDLTENGHFDTSKILSIGDSRQAMTGEAVDALAHMYDREVIWGDYIATCFEHAPSFDELIKLLPSLGEEGLALISLGKRLAKEGQERGDIHEILDVYAGTFDLHPLNALNELAWVLPLMCGDTGRYGDAQPLDVKGARTHLNGDTWSSGGRHWLGKYAIRPGLHFYCKNLPDGRRARHLDLADPAIQADRYDRLVRIKEELMTSDNDTNAIDFDYVASGIRKYRQSA